jgi:uncharacterized membrane protein YidH (DUF202 family)
MEGNKAVGGILLGGGAFAILFGITRLNSFESQMSRMFGQTDVTSIAALAGGAAAAVVGLVILLKKRA